MTEPVGKQWITTTQGRTLTGYSQAYVRQIARDDRITAQKLGRDWLINRESLLAYKRRMDRLGPQKHNPWRTLPHQSGELGS
jgi:excisionase family DNA binding protein